MTLAGTTLTGGEIALLLFAAALAGLVRGFSGFGTAMIFLPLAALVLPPFQAMLALVCMDIVGPLPAVPRALRDGHPRDVMRMALAMVVGVPLGLWILTVSAPEIFRWGTSGATLTLLACLVGGFRYRGVLRRWMIWATGAASGLLTGVAGLPGPPVILFYMASSHPATVIRANLMVFLVFADIVLLVMLWIFGQFVLGAALVGTLLILPYMATTMLGSAIFRPDHERDYRAAAYVIIAGSAIAGLPLWDGWG